MIINVVYRKLVTTDLEVNVHPNCNKQTSTTFKNKYCWSKYCWFVRTAQLIFEEVQNKNTSLENFGDQYVIYSAKFPSSLAKRKF